MRCLALGVLLCSAVCGITRDAEYSRRVWRSEDGLPQNRIQTITQTPDGYLWIGTPGGLVRFDGVRFVVFDHSNTPALGDDSILALCQARDGSMWIGTEGGGLVRMKDGAFQAFGAAQGLTNPFIRAIKEERDGALLVGSDRGFFRLREGKFTRLDAHGDAPILAAFSVAEDASGSTWAGTTYGLFAVEGDRLVRRRDDYRALGTVSSILDAGDGVLWLVSSGGIRQLIHGEVATGRTTGVARPRCIARDHLGQIWIGTTGNGLVRLDPAKRAPVSLSEGLPDSTVLTVFEDREQNLWVGTQDGLLRMTRSAVRTLGADDGLADDNVSTIYEDPAGALWIGTVSGGLYRREGSRMVRFRPAGEVRDFPARGIYIDREGVAWIASGGQGFLRIEKGRVERFSMANGLRSNNIRQFLEDRSGAVWIATGSGLTRRDSHGGIRTFYLEDGLAYGGVRALAVDGNGDLLAGTDGGLNRVRDGRFIRDPVFEQIGKQRIWSILLDDRGSLWLGTRGTGLVRIRNGRIARFTTREGLLNNSINQILDDGHGRFWMSSPAGIFSAGRDELDAMAEGAAGPIAVAPWGMSTGLRSSQMNGGAQTAGCVTRRGEIWFPSVKGAVAIEPGQMHVPVSAPVRIESVMVDDRPLPLTREIVIPPGRGKLQIDYTSPDLLSPDNVTFKYMLEGYDKTWNPSPRQRTAYYTNLAPGRYTFHVVARDGAQPEHVSEALLPVVWKPRFQETVWFYALAAMACVLCAFGAMWLYARQTRARYALVLAERTRLAREMHDTVIQGCVGVSTLLEAARSMPAGAADKARELVDHAASQVRDTIDEAREAVWDLRHSSLNGAGEERGVARTIENLAQQIQAVEGIPVRAEVTGTPSRLDEKADRNLLLVAREAIRNAVTHARAGQIRVILRFDPTEVRLEVSDDGQGFNVDIARDNGHYGIIGMRERIEQSGGRFELSSSSGRGTHVIARLPVKVKA